MSNSVLTNGKKSLNGMKRILLLVGLAVAAALPAQAADYVFMYVSGGTYNILQGNTTTPNTTTFSLATCVWSGTSGSTFSNNSVYIYLSSGAVLSTNTRNLTIDGNTIYRTGSSYYLIYNGGWQRNTTPANVVYAFSTQSAASLTTPTVTAGQSTFTDLGSYTYGHGTSSYTPALYKFTPNSGSGTAYYAIDGGTPTTSSAAPASVTSGIAYTWSLADGSLDDGHVRIDAATGEVTYYNSYASNTTKAIKVTATHTASGASTKSANYSITFNTLPVANPTGITATDKSISSSITWTVDNYTLISAAGTQPYSYITATSADPSVATVTNSVGTVSITGVAVGSTTITLTAYQQDNTTVAATATFTLTVIATGISGGVVTLNDLEDHTWSYYSDADCPIRSLNPVDVKITYYGNGTGTVSTTNGATPGNTSWTANASGVQVSSSETANTFVYYKTLERTDGSTSANPTGRCAYTTIPNPFSVRPTYQYATGTLNKYCGFYAWRVKSVSGGTIHTAATGGTQIDANGIINAETEVFFTPTSETGMTVELEALWARAYVVESNTTTGLNNGVSYERNFVFLSSNTTLYNAALSYPVTYTTVDPATGAGSKQTITIRGGFTCNANTKFENVIFAQYNNGNQTMTANNHDLIIGRGCTGTINYVRGIGGNITSPNYTIRLESGTINYLSFLRGYSTGGNNATDVPNTHSSVGGTPNIKGVLGCDYDRATNSGITDNLIISNGAFYGYSVSEGSGITYSDNSFTAHVKSGKIGNNFTIDGSSYTANADQSFYIGVAGERVRGHRKIYVEGGQLASIAGGIDATQNQNNNSVTIRIKGGHVRGSVYGGAARSAAYGNRNIIVTGGQVTGWLGGGCNGEAYPAGQTSEDTYGGITNGLTKVYFGGTGICGGTGSNVNINGSQGGIVFGAGKGVEGNTTSGRMSQGTTVVVADECDIERNVYGGGNFGYAQTSTDVYISGGTVHGSVFGGSNQNNGPTINLKMIGGLIEGGLYGGSNTSGTITNHITMHIDGGQVGTSSQPANIHGGGYGSNTMVNGSISLTLGKDCNATSGVTVYGDVYGGSAEGIVNSNTSYPTEVTLYKGIIYGALYGGGLGTASHAANVNGPVSVKVFGGSVRTNDGTGENGSGGVFGCNNTNGAPQSTVTVDIYGTDPAPDANSFALFAVYGGGNRSDYTGVPVVTVHGCNNSIEYVYGGGNASAVRGTNVTIWGGHIGNAFGGGNGFSVTNNHSDASAPHYNPGANITASGANLTIHGGTIDAAFGGSNQWGYINGGITVAVAEQDEPGSNPCTGAAYGSCSNLIVELYGGGNQAPAVTSEDVYISPKVTISSCDMKITNLFGGAKNANHGANINLVVEKGQFENVFGGNNIGGTITGNVTLTLKGGTMVNAFGGNNQGGSITGTITVLVDSTGTDCPLKVDNVYGGGNEAAYSPNDATAATPTVNFVNGTVRNAVFGGGLGSAAKITANPTVNIGGTGSKHAIVGGTRIDGTPGVGNVYGGGSRADVLKDGANTGNTSVTLSGNAVVKGNVYGGGNEANVEGNSSVKLEE